MSFETDIDVSEHTKKNRPDPEVHKLLRESSSFKFSYINSFNSIHDYFNSDPKSAYESLDQTLKILSTHIEKFEKLKVGGESLKETIDYYKAHHEYCLALKSFLDKKIEDAKTHLMEGMILFERVGDNYNAGFLRSQLENIESGYIQIPFLEKRLYFITTQNNPSNNHYLF